MATKQGLDSHIQQHTSKEMRKKKKNKSNTIDILNDTSGVFDEVSFHHT